MHPEFQGLCRFFSGIRTVQTRHVWFVAKLNQFKKKKGNAKMFVICLVYFLKKWHCSYLIKLNVQNATLIAHQTMLCQLLVKHLNNDQFSPLLKKLVRL